MESFLMKYLTQVQYIYIFYKILRNNLKIVYEPIAVVWHKHRETFKSFKKQLFNYSKAHIAYHLTILFNDGDRRALTRMLFQLPKYHLLRIIKRLIGKSDYSILLILLEILGNIQGCFVYLITRFHRKKIKRQKIVTQKQKINLESI
jgi:hypothetical protein